MRTRPALIHSWAWLRLVMPSLESRRSKVTRLALSGPRGALGRVGAGGALRLPGELGGIHTGLSGRERTRAAQVWRHDVTLHCRVLKEKRAASCLVAEAGRDGCMSSGSDGMMAAA